MHAELSREPRAEAPIMSAMHAGVMTTSTEMMYAQDVTLTYIHPKKITICNIFIKLIITQAAMIHCTW